MALSKAAQLILHTARAQLGQSEHPDGSNTGDRVREYQRATWLPGSYWPWCAAYVCWVYAKAGHRLPWRTASAYALLDYGRRQGWASPVPVPGCIVVFNIGEGHTGIVESFTPKTVTSIDGNVSDSVGRRTRSRSLVRGYVIPPWLKNSRVKPTPLVPAPRYEIVTSVNGHKKLVISDRPLPKLLKFLPRVLKNRNSVTIRRSKKKGKPA